MHRLRPYLHLVRLPNVFTALADIALAALATHALPEHTPRFMLRSLASACLYCGGMAWNDFFDLEQDKRERPFRPIPIRCGA
jgi:4-hydroxybenzoate polyprenyltransferase